MKFAWKSQGAGAALILLLTAVAYIPALRGGFVFDDNVMIIDNPMVKASDGLYRFWFTTESADYWPLTSTVWWLEWRLWGANAAGYHVVNVLLHAVNAILVWMVLKCLKIPGAWLVGLVFALHPVNVATVAWISEQKNTISMLFYLIAILQYLRFDENGRWRCYGFSLAAFALALLAKTAVVMFPIVLLGCLWWTHGRLRRNDFLYSAPFFALSLALGLVTIWFQHSQALDTQSTRIEGFAYRLAVAGCAPWFYLYKELLPFHLSAIYPKWEINDSNWLSYVPGAILIVCLLVFWWRRKTWGRPLLFALGYSVVTLFPVLGFFRQSYHLYSWVADHWQYCSIIGPIALVVAGGEKICRRMGERSRSIEVLASVTVLVLLGAATWRRSYVYGDEEAFWRDTLAENSDAWVAHSNLGFLLASEGKLQEAITQDEQAVELKPDYPEARNNLGVALARAGRMQEAIVQFEEALKIRPTSAEVRNNLGFALSLVGKLQEAIGQYEKVLQIRPDYAEAHSNLGLALEQVGKAPEAVGHFEQVVRIKPDSAEAYYNLGNALVLSGKPEDSITYYQEALRLKPDYAGVHYNMAVVLAQAGKAKDAIWHYEQVLAIQPDSIDAQNKLAWLLATLPPAEGGDPSRALTLAQKACELTGNKVPVYLDTLAVAYAATGRFGEAIATGEKALDLTRAAGQSQLAAEIETRLEMYQNGRAYR